MRKIIIIIASISLSACSTFGHGKFKSVTSGYDLLSDEGVSTKSIPTLRGMTQLIDGKLYDEGGHPYSTFSEAGTKYRRTYSGAYLVGEPRSNLEIDKDRIEYTILQ